MTFGNDMDPQLNQYVLALANELAKEPKWYLDVIPSYSTLSIVYDPVVIRKLKTTSAFEWVRAKVTETIKSSLIKLEVKSRTITIPVCYDPSVAPDIKRLAAEKKISVEKVIELHTRQTYCVYLLGFLPGFAYMGKVDDRIVMPRLDKPRARVPVGSVGIAGNQTGIYPLESPGGWNLIGKTPVKLFDASLPDPVFFRPGDKVKFKSISMEEFETFDQNTMQMVLS
ncbi:MAG: 5-oxoprolinase subunit PxpB [Cyclobacteriaceae bacterium]|nr:5-oxoprolinase subunit PxpB [Cyclobacteriaceae bacterium]